MSQLERTQWIHAVLKSGAHLHWTRVAEQFEVKKSTVFADMRYMRDRMAAPIESAGSRGWHYSDTKYELPFLWLSEREAATLRRTLLAAQTHLPHADATVVQRLATLLSPYVRGLPTYGGEMPRSAEIFRSGHPVLAPHVAVTDDRLADFRRAVDHRHRVRLTYYSAHRDERTERTIRPYALLNWEGELYLIGYCEWRKADRDFALHRILDYDVQAPNDAFIIPDTFDLNAYLQTSLGLRRGDPLVTVRVRFSPKQSRWVRERIYHPSQTHTEDPDNGSVTLSLRISGTAEAKQWVLSFGADAEVLEPEELRQEIAAELQQMRKLYT